MDGTAHNHGKVGGKHAELRFLLQFSKDVLVGRIKLDDDRRTVGLCIVNDDVDLVLSIERLLHPRHLRHAGLRLVAGDKLHDVFHDVVLGGIDVCHDVGEFRELLLEVIDEVAHGKERHVLVELLEVVINLAVKGTQLSHGAAKLLGHLLTLLLYGIPLFGGKAEEFLLAQRFSVHHGDDQQAHGRALYDKSLLLRLDVKVLKEALALRFGLPHRGVALVGIVLALKRLGEHPLRLGDKGGHLLLKHCPRPGGKRKGLWFILILEVVDIAPVRRYWFGA